MWRDTARAMSEENIDLIREAIDAWNSGDMERLRDVYDPNIVARPLPDWPELPEPVYVGRDRLMREFREMRDTWDTHDVLEVLGDFVTAGDRVIVRYLWKAQGHGPPMSMELTYVYTVRRGRVLEIELFWDHDAALEAVGLSE